VRARLARLFAAPLCAAALCAAQVAPPAYTRLAELSELGLDAEVVATGLPLVSGAGELARDGQAAALVARALFAVGREDEAFRLLDAAQPSDDAGQASLTLMRARLLLERDRLKEALALLTLEPGAWSKPRFPGAAENLVLLGRALARSERHDLAEPVLEAFVRAAPLHPEGPAAWHMLFDCAMKRGDLARAEACRAEQGRLMLWHELLKTRRLQVRRSPEAREPRLGLFLLWLEAGELDEAQRALEGLLERHPGDAEAWLHQGELDRKRGRPQDAERAYARALELAPGDQRARYSLALLFAAAGRAADARRALETVLASEAADDPRFLGAHLELARLLSAAGEAEAARARYELYVARGGREPLELR
jgi:predicted Zn-dependent protease